MIDAKMEAYLKSVENEALEPSVIRPWSQSSAYLRRASLYSPAFNRKSCSSLFKRLDLNKSPEELIFSTYCLALQRLPDAEGYRHNLEELPRLGIKKLFQQIYYSRERGLRIRAQVGLFQYILFRLKKIGFSLSQRLSFLNPQSSFRSLES